MEPYERFGAWRHCHELTLAVYQETRSWPSSELYGLTSQVRRAAVSAAVNIVEGVAKKGRRELGRYLDISNGSLAELGYLLRLAMELGYLDEQNGRRLQSKWSEAGKTTMVLSRRVRESK